MKIKINYDNHVEIVKILYENSKILQKNNINFDDLLKSIQYGSGKTNKLTELKVIYEKHEYIFEQSLENNYILYTNDKEENDCIFVIIDNNMAEIHGIGNYKNCLNKINQNIGSHLLKLTIKMLKENKKLLGINMITLTDNSKKRCSNNILIELSIMKILLTGHTWYGAYGFKPVNYVGTNASIDVNAYKLYKENKKKFQNLLIKDVNLLNYINMTSNEKLIKATKQIIEINPNMFLKDFLTKILTDFDKGCVDFSKFYLQLYDDNSILKSYNYKKINTDNTSYEILPKVYGLSI